MAPGLIPNVISSVNADAVAAVDAWCGHTLKVVLHMSLQQMLNVWKY